MMTQEKTTDICIDHCGSIVMVTPMTAAGRDWIDENVASEDWQWMGLSLAVDVRYAENLVEGMQEAGLTVDC